MEKKELTQEQKDRIVLRWQEMIAKDYEESQKRVKLLNQPETSKLAYELQKRLVQCCLDYINETGNKNIWRVIFSADCLQESAKYGSWQPCTDSTCELEDENETISFSA